jgi:DNA repair protein RadD
MKLPSVYDNWTNYTPGPSGIQLRDYQAEAIEATWDYFERTSSGNPLIVAPTGSGKSMILAGICHEAWTIKPGTRIMMLTHVQELIEQNELALKRYWPDAPVGVYSAGMKRKEPDAPILFGGVQSVCRAVDRIGQADLVIVDEAHLTPKSGNGQYLTAFKALRSIRPNLRVIGLTATPFRTDSGYLHKGAGAMFDDIVYDIPLLDLMDKGHICRVTSKATKSRINVEGVMQVGGDFVGNQLEQAAMSGDNVADAVTEVIKRGQDRRGWLFFASGKKHAEMILEEVKGRGISCGMVMGDTPKPERKQLIQDYKDRKIRAMVSVGVLTTGFDAPHVDLIALMRPTMSPGLHVQIVGRGLRTCPGKENCVVLDFAGNIERHGPLDSIRVREPGDGDGTAPVKECPMCQELVAAGKLECPCCGYEFPPREVVKHEATPSYLSIISDDRGDEPIPEKPKLAVSGVSLRRHQKQGKEDSVCVIYQINMATSIREWLCFDHGKFMRDKAIRIWILLGGQLPAPATTDDALDRAGEITSPSYIRVKEGKWPEVTERIFMDREPGDDLDDEQDQPETIKLGSDDFDYGDIPF